MITQEATEYIKKELKDELEYLSESLAILSLSFYKKGYQDALDHLKNEALTKMLK